MKIEINFNEEEQAEITEFFKEYSYLKDMELSDEDIFNVLIRDGIKWWRLINFSHSVKEELTEEEFNKRLDEF
jgi:hypothetical protein